MDARVQKETRGHTSYRTHRLTPPQYPCLPCPCRPPSQLWTEVRKPQTHPLWAVFRTSPVLLSPLLFSLMIASRVTHKFVDNGLKNPLK